MVRGVITVGIKDLRGIKLGLQSFNYYIVASFGLHQQQFSSTKNLLFQDIVLEFHSDFWPWKLEIWDYDSKIKIQEIPICDFPSYLESYQFQSESHHHNRLLVSHTPLPHNYSPSHSTAISVLGALQSSSQFKNDQELESSQIVEIVSFQALDEDDISTEEASFADSQEPQLIV